MHLGEVDVSAQDIEVQAHEWVKARQQRIEKAVSHLPEATADMERQRSYPLALADFLDAMRRVGNLARQSRRGVYDEDTGETPAVLGLRDIVMRRGLSYLSPDVNGWLNYLAELDARFMELPKHTPAPQLIEEIRAQHTLIVGATGHGKSELMKALMHHYVLNPTAAVVVIDRTGDMAKQVANWPEFAAAKERLDYIRPGLVPGFTPELNPLALGRKLPAEWRDGYAENVARMLRELLPASELTANMKNLTINCVRVLLEQDGTSLLDLYTMLGENKTPERDRLIEAGKRYNNFVVSRFFHEDFQGENYKSSKNGLRSRLIELFSSNSFTQLVGTKGCYEIEEAIIKRKIIVFNLASLSTDGQTAIGRMLIMLLWNLAELRKQDEGRARAPVHVFVDEAQTMAGPAIGLILDEMRKYKIHLTLAQPVGGSGFSREEREKVFNNTAIKIFGSNDSGEMASVLRVKPNTLPKLPPHQFWCRWGHDGEIVRLKVRSDLADNKRAMSAQDWAALVESWKGTVYKPLEVRPQHEAKPFNDLPLD